MFCLFSANPRFDPDFQTPLILGESLDFSDSEESQFVGAFSDGLWAKSEPFLSMSSFQKPAAGAVLDYASTRSLHDAGSYSTYGQSPYVTTSLVPSPMADQASQASDCVPYMPSNEYTSSYDEAQSPMMGARSRPVPEVATYSPQRGCEGTRVMVQIQSPFDLHSSTYSTVYLVFGSKRCECLPHFLGFQSNNAFQYMLAVEAPSFISTGSPSFAVPIQVVLETQGDCQATTLQVGVYTYEHVPQPSPPADTRKRKFSSYSDNPISAPAKRPAPGNVMPKIEPQDNYSYRDNRSASFSPYLQPLSTMTGFVAPFHAASSPRNGCTQYSTASATTQPAIRAPSPLTPAWSPSFVSVTSDGRNPGMAVAHGIAQHKGPSPMRSTNPTLIRTSTLQQASGLGQSQTFNPYAIYPTKAVLKLNGDLDGMAEGWSKDEVVAQRRLVEFTRTQTGSTIHADFKPVAPEKRSPNSICISCISWEGKDECFVTSVDTIYLLESLVGVRFTVEEKNRIRRNLEGFRPLTVSKAKQDSEDFFKVIMGFPAPKPRNIEKDVKVFPWKILSHALKKIIGKYSASYSSTAGALPTPITNYTSHGTGSDSGTEPHTAASPQSVSDSGLGNYAHTLGAPIYTQAEHASLTAAPDLRSVIPAHSQPYSSVGAYPYPAPCQPQHANGMVTPSPRSAWDIHGLGAAGAPTTAASANACYAYMDPVYPLHDSAHGQ
ncbi:hypothetical protein N7532_008476 [Penicillium argentinense]|uniref:DUF7082 domain-containing protein n=1 Tax=Penicillium argentinense TaxID=1131581 RepID=A0A9W9K2J6_9EURO|nr:uncharacterized protein N7532_008476 [Penicillium argentinense]KAJ5089792.1 hypothetical protein N7532_008476 [Penicillium argentinense]